MGYRLVRGVIRLLLWLFYSRIDVVGRERVPAAGALIVAANHHNSVADAMLIIVAGAVIYPVFWALEGWLGWRLTGLGGLMVFLVLLAPSGLLAMAWRERLARVGRQARAFGRFLVERNLHASLRHERRALIDELSAPAERVPAAGGAGVPRNDG